MKKTLAVLATVAAVGATAVVAPAEARGIGPGLAFGLAAGAITAGAIAASQPYLLRAGILLRSELLLRAWSLRLLRRRPELLSSPLLAASLVSEKPGATLRAFLLLQCFSSR